MHTNKPLNKGLIENMVVKGGMERIEALATDILAQSVADCPVLHNNMRASGKKIRSDKEYKVYIGFGKGVSKSYTAYQHENVGLHHKVGRAKWLQNAFDNQTKGMKKK